MPNGSRFERLSGTVQSEELDELDAALLVNETLAPGFDEADTRARLDELTRAFGDEPVPEAERLCAFMREQGFTGADEYYGLRNSCLDEVLKRRSGIPISLAIIYLEVARGAGMAAVGINYPGHFLIEVDEHLVDPLRAEVTQREVCENWLREAGYGGSLAAAFRPTSARDVALRMLNNARGILAAEGRWSEALEIIDHQRVLAPGELQLELDSAELWAASGAPDMARTILEGVRHRVTDSGLGRMIDQRLRSLPAPGSDPVLN